MREVQIGDPVVYVDPTARQHNALVTGMGDPEWFKQLAPPRLPWVNVILVSDNPDMTDSYGRQIQRQTSLSHQADQHAHGMYWMFPGDVPNPIVEVKS